MRKASRKPQKNVSRRELLVVIAVCAACSSGTSARVRELPSSAKAWLATAPTTYTSIASSPQARDAETEALATAFERQVGGGIRRDPALDSVAHIVARIGFETNQSPSQSLVQWLFWKAGSTAVHARSSSHWSRGTGGFRASALDARLDEVAKSIAAEHGPLVYGFARDPMEHNHTAQAVVVGRVAVELETPLAKDAAASASVVLRGRLDASYAAARLFVDTVDGRASKSTLSVAADGTFQASAPLPSRPGRYFLEILAHDKRERDEQNTIALWLPLYADTHETSEPDAWVVNDAPNPADPATWGETLIRAIDAKRATMAEPPVNRDPRLEALARTRVAALVSSPRGLSGLPPLREELEKLGFTNRPRHERSTQIDRLADYQQTELSKPEHRGVWLAADPPTIAIGIAPLPVKPNRDPEYLLLAEELEAVVAK